MSNILNTSVYQINRSSEELEFSKLTIIDRYLIFYEQGKSTETVTFLENAFDPKKSPSSPNDQKDSLEQQNWTDILRPEFIVPILMPMCLLFGLIWYMFIRDPESNDYRGPGPAHLSKQERDRALS